METQTNSLPKKTGLHYWEIGLVFMNILLAINGVIFVIYVMIKFLKLGAEVNLSGNKVKFNNYHASTNFFVFNRANHVLGLFINIR